jgi:hypothetical protein
MSVPAKFMAIALDRIDRDLYDEIFKRAVELDHEEQIAASRLRRGSSQDTINKPYLIERIEAHLNDEPQPVEIPHIKQRMERRLDINVSKSDLGDLARAVKAGGPNVEIIKQTMDLVQECVLNWRGKHFVVIYSKSRDKLITAYPKQKKPKKKLPADRPKDWRSDKDWRTPEE